MCFRKRSAMENGRQYLQLTVNNEEYMMVDLRGEFDGHNKHCFDSLN